MSTIINGSSPSITFSDSTTQATAGLTAASPTIASGVLTFPDATTQSSGSGVAKAWVKFNGGYSNTAGVINSSYNVSSITVNAAGDYTINFTNAMSNANYAWAGDTALLDNNGSNIYCVACSRLTAPAAGSLRINSFVANSAALANLSYVTCIVMAS